MPAYEETEKSWEGDLNIYVSGTYSIDILVGNSLESGGKEYSKKYREKNREKYRKVCLSHYYKRKKELAEIRKKYADLT